MAWAVQPLAATTALLSGDDKAGYVPFDYLVDTIQRGATAAVRVPDTALRVMLEYADPAGTLAVVRLAVEYGWYELADTAGQQAREQAAGMPAEHPEDLAARHALAWAAVGRGDYRRAERRC